MISLMMTMVKFSFLTQARDSQSTGTPCCRQRNDHQPAMPRWPNTRWDLYSFFTWPIFTLVLANFHHQHRWPNTIFNRPVFQILTFLRWGCSAPHTSCFPHSELLSLFVQIICPGCQKYFHFMSLSFDQIIQFILLCVQFLIPLLNFLSFLSRSADHVAEARLKKDNHRRRGNGDRPSGGRIFSP